MLEKRGRFYRYGFMFRGKRVRVQTKISNLEVARKAMETHHEQLARGEFNLGDPVRPEPPPTLAEYIPKFLAWSKTVHRKKTYVLHRANCRALERHLGAKRLNEVNRGSVEDFMVARSQESPVNVTAAGVVVVLEGKVSPCTVNRAVTTLRKLFNQAQGRWPALTNPTQGVAKLKEPKPQYIVSEEEFERYLQVSSGDLRDVAILMRERGLRPQDACELTCSQCDFTQNTVELWPKPEPRSTRAIGGKTENSSRLIDLTDSAPALEVLQRRVAEAQARGGKFLFPMRDWKGRLKSPERGRNPNSLSKAHRAARRKARIEGAMRLYDLRHTFANNALQDGMSTLVLQGVLGHSDPKITDRYRKRNDIVAQRAAFARAATQKAGADVMAVARRLAEMPAENVERLLAALGN